MKKLDIIRRGLLLLVVVASTLLLNGAALAIENGGIGGKPANPRPDNPRTQSIFVYELKPGDKIDDAVQVVNNTDQEKTLLVYPADSQVASDGAFACAQKVDTQVGVATWIKLAEEQVTLKANTSKNVAFTVSVPSTASAGEHGGCIVIQDSAQRATNEGNNVTLSFRSAIRVAITIPGEITKDLDFVGPPVVKTESGTIKVTVGLKNNGNVSLDTDINAYLSSLAGNKSRVGGGQYPVLPNSQATFNFETKTPFWGGFYKIEASATYGSDTDKSLGESGDSTTLSSPSKWVFISPQPAALTIELISVIVAVAAGSTWLRKRKHHATLHATSKTYKAKKSDSLQSIAKNHDVSWKLIAKINKLKAPYHIEPGQELKIPPKLKANKSHAKGHETTEKE